MRKLHRWPALIAAVFLILLSLSGAALSVFPAMERLAAPAAQISVADLAASAMAAHPGVEQIRRAPSGKITVWWFDGGVPGSAVFDPAAGADMGSADPNPAEQWLTNLHRALLMDDNGRIVMAIAAGAMLVLALSGVILVARRVGGLRNWFSRQRGPFAARFHTEIARITVPFLLLTSVTALWMVAATFEFLPSDEANAAFPREVSTAAPLTPRVIPAFQSVPITQLRDLAFPADAADVYTLTTAGGMAFVDQGTGAVLTSAANGPWASIYEWIYMLHTGQGAAIWGLILGLVTLSVPVLAVTGTLAWAKGRRKGLRGMARAGAAQTVILVASEGGTTWGFAGTLARALQGAGQAVHVAPLADFAPQTYGAAQRIVIMAATWGDGEAPVSARGALARMTSAGDVPMAILGFGDSSFARFCGFAEDLAAAGDLPMLMPMGRVDRQSPQDFARWGRDFGAAIGIPLELNHQPTLPAVLPLTLISRRDYGEGMQAPAAILRFALPRMGLWARLMGKGRFQAGDLLAILPEGSSIPRHYSLASSSKDGFAEIAVRKHPGGICSGQLMALQVGQSVQGFMRDNPAFHLDRAKTPLILIGAGTGVGPLAGFIRAQGTRRPMHLWFGARHPDTDLFYGEELHDWSQTGQLTGLRTAFSRYGPKLYVQDALRQDGDTLRRLIADGARIMVCGGREMAMGVQGAIADILGPAAPARLKAEGRYAEDVY